MMQLSLIVLIVGIVLCTLACYLDQSVSKGV